MFHICSSDRHQKLVVKMCLNHKQIRLVLEVELLTCHPLCYSFALDWADEKDRKELTRCKFWMLGYRKADLCVVFVPNWNIFSGIIFFVTSTSMHSFSSGKAFLYDRSLSPNWISTHQMFLRMKTRSLGCLKGSEKEWC